MSSVPVGNRQRERAGPPEPAALARTGDARDGIEPAGPHEPLSMNGDIVAFGPFQLDRLRHELLKDGVPVSVGSRAIAILLELTRNAGEILSTRELLRRVWPNTVVEEGTVRVHVALLRRILRACDPGYEYVQNVTSRGYRFVAPVSRPDESVQWSGAAVSHGTVSKLPLRQPLRRNNLPARLTSIVGRSPTIRALAEKMAVQRLLTVTGQGGSGKTTVAIGVAYALLDASADTCLHGVCFVDLAAITEARFVTNALASVLGVAPLAEDPLPDVLACLANQSLLLVLDNCEHVIEASAKLAESVLRHAPKVHVLATSREPLRAEGESVHDLAPLDVPPEECDRTRANLLEFPAMELFLARAEACAGAEFEGDDLLLIADICRLLAGNPLAIEITAAHVGLLGVHTLAISLYLSIGGRRTAEPRHRSLRATFDWSYALLTSAEQATFRRLSVFAGCFDLDCALAVVADAGLTDVEVFESLMSLASKSLVVAATNGEAGAYRLLDLPHAYAHEKLLESGELETIRHRHARMWCSVGAVRIHAHARRGAEWVSVFGPRIQDLRAATRWSFSSASGSSLSTKLTLTSLWFEFVLAAESSGEPAWAELSAYLLRSSEGALLSGLEDILENSRGRNETSMGDLTVLQQIAHGGLQQKTALWSLWFERAIKRDYRIAINLSRAAHERGVRSSAHEAALMDRMLAVAHHYAGDQTLACQHACWALDVPGTASAASVEALLQCHTRTILARALWLRGFADSALEASRQSVEAAERSGNARMLCMTLLVAIAVAIWCGNIVAARQALDRLHEQSMAHSLEYHQLWADCLRMILAAPAAGLPVIEPLQLSSDPLTSSQYLDILGSLREELVSHDAIVRAENGRCGWCTPEILRVKAERLIREGAIGGADALLQTAMDTAQRQGALAWELRTAMTLARLWSEQGRVHEARDMLSGVYDRFTEGFDTVDLKSARQLLKQLSAHARTAGRSESPQGEVLSAGGPSVRN